MNVYDFDKTIFYPDSSVTFVKWELKRHPLIFLRCLPVALWHGLLYLLRIISKEQLKEGAMRFIRYLPDIDADLRLYWDEHESWVCPWYLKQQRPDDLVISASPEFVVKPMTDRLGIRLIATSMDKHTAKIDGLNCHGEEKVRRFYKEFPENTVVENFYSDSLTDTPLAKLAVKAYLIVDKGQTPVPWPDN